MPVDKITFEPGQNSPGGTNAGQIQSIPVSSTPPTLNQVLLFNGTQWVPGLPQRVQNTSTTDTDPAVIDLVNAPTIRHTLLAGLAGIPLSWKPRLNILGNGTFEIVYNATWTGTQWTKDNTSYVSWRYEFNNGGVFTIQRKNPGAGNWNDGTWDSYTGYSSDGTVYGAGPVNVYAGGEGYQVAGNIVGVGLAFPKTFPSPPSSVTLVSGKSSAANITVSSYNTFNQQDVGMGIYWSVAATGTWYAYVYFAINGSLIKLIESTKQAVQRCAGFLANDDPCPNENLIDLTTLTAGSGTAGRYDKDAVVLPACPNCGSVETIFARWDTTPARARGTLEHRRKMGHNFARKVICKVLKRQNAACKGDQDKEMGDPPDILPGWPATPDGSF